ncbi:TPA: hypothetical protein NBJ18_004299 [Citrobacter farmeri]|nr:hypothetical protein [Citrobacter farmeri]
MIFRKRYDDYIRKMSKLIHKNTQTLPVSYVVHPVKDGSGIIEIKIGIISKKTQYMPECTKLSEAVSCLSQNVIGGNLNAVEFLGTNIIFDQRKATLIKDSSKDEWSLSAVEKDYKRIFGLRNVL